MPQYYASEDLSSQKLCESYNKLLQIYSGSIVLNGSGSRIQYLNVTASYALNCNCAGSGSGGTNLHTGSTYPITSSWSLNSKYSISSSYAFNFGNSVTQSFCSSSIWSFNHNLKDRYVIIQAYDENNNQIIPEIINLLDQDTAILAFGQDACGTAVATRGGMRHLSVTASFQTGSKYPITASYLYGNAKIQNGIYFNTASAVAASDEGYIYWDSSNHTLAIRSDITSSTLQVGQESWIRYIAGENISNGDAIYIYSAEGNDGHPICKKAIADGTRTKSAVIAIATHNNPSGSHGFATTSGYVNELDTTNYPAGSQLFLSNTIPGAYLTNEPNEPYERISLGYCIRQNATVGRILANIIAIPDAFRAFVGATLLPSIRDNGDGTVTIGSGSVALNTQPDGSGDTRNWTLTGSTLTVPYGLNLVSYIIADYNNGLPKWRLVSSYEDIDDIQKTAVYTVTRALTNEVAYASWDEPGNLLANKLLDRVVDVYGNQRADGMILGQSGSRYVTISSGSVWVGASKNHNLAFNSLNNAMLLLYHSGSNNYTASRITQYVNNQYDNGTGLSTLLPNKFVVNYVYKSITNKNRAMIMLSDTFGKLLDAQNSQPPSVPGDLLQGGILVGRAIFQSGLPSATQIDSAFTTQFNPSSVLFHNELAGLQGGITNEYYHLTSAEYTKLQSNTASYALKSANSVSASFATRSLTASYALKSATSVSASFATRSLTASYALKSATSVTSSYIIASGISYPIKTITGNYNITTSDYTLLCNAASGVMNVKLPTASTANTKIFNIKKKDTSGNIINITATGGSYIDYDVTQSISNRGTNLSVQSDGTQYWIL